MSERKVVLVSGAGGFIGRWAVPSLVDRGYQVHALVGRTLQGRGAPPMLAGAHTHWLDLFDAAAVSALIEAVHPSHLLHFAWVATPGVYWRSPDNYRWLSASERLLRDFHAAGGVRAVMAGTVAEYDWTQVGVCEEEGSPLADSAGAAATPYQQCKLSLQRAVARCTAESGMSSAWGRLFFQYGPHEHPERLVASVISRLLTGRPAPCTHGRQIRSFLYVADVGAAFAALLDSPVLGPVNIGSDTAIRIADLLDEVACQIGRPDLLQLGARDAPDSEPPLLLPKTERLRLEVAWQPRFDLRSGIAATIAWWREHLTC